MMKVWPIVIAAAATLTFAACGKKADTDPPKTAERGGEVAKPTPPPEPPPPAPAPEPPPPAPVAETPPPAPAAAPAATPAPSPAATAAPAAAAPAAAHAVRAEPARAKAPQKAPEPVKAAATRTAEAAPAPQPDVHDQQKAMAARLLGTDKPKDPPSVLDPNRPKPVRKVVPKLTDNEQPLPEEPPTVGISDREFFSVVNSWRGVKACIQTTGIKVDDGKGALRVEFTISMDGSVTEARVLEVSDERADAIADCVEKSAKQMKFPALSGIPSLSKNAKFVF